MIKERKRTRHPVDFDVPVNHRVKIKESEKTHKYMELDKRTKKVVEHEGDGGTKSFGKKTREIGNQMKSRDHPDHSIVKFDSNTEKSPGIRRKLVISQIPVKYY